MCSHRNVTGAALLLLAMVLAGCTGKEPPPATVIVTSPVIETRIVQVTREIEKTVVVTATPAPTPTYASPINAAAGTLLYPLPADVLTLDPQEAHDATSLLVLQQLYEGLFDLRADGSITPAAATGFTASSDSTVYTVTLRAGLTWSDGQPVTAQHYADGVCRLLDPAVGSPFAYLLTEVASLQGAAAYAGGDLADCAQVGVAAVDDLTLRFTLARPVATFPALLTSHIFWPARLDAIKAAANGAMTPTAQSAIPVRSVPGTIARSPQPAITNGPYLLAGQPAADRIVLVKNPAYWNAAQVAVERIEFVIVPDPGRQLALYEAGDLMVAEFPAQEMARIQADPGLARELHVLPQAGTSYLAFNTQRPPTDDVNVRRAIASALDRRALIEQVLAQPWHVPARSLVPPVVPGYVGGEGAYPFDLEAARAFLAQAGYRPDNPIPPVELWYNRDGNNDLVFRAVGDMLEAAGIPVRLVSTRWDLYVDGLENCHKPAGAGAIRAPGECSYNLYRMGWVMDYPDASSMLQAFSPHARFQYTGWASADYDRLLAEATAEQDQVRRVELYRKAEHLLLREIVAFIPLQHYDRTVLVKHGIEFDFPPFGPPNLHYWRLR
ncbi:MAG: peptide ABC transporter substrate-binding protein [Anaerolineae bacterium]